MGKVRSAAAAVIVMVLTSCGGDGDDSAGPEASRKAKVRPTPIEDVADIISLPGSPDYMVEGLGSVWVWRDLRPTVRIDPASAEVADEIDSQPGPCQAIAFAADRLWVCSGEGDVVSVDPDSGRVTSRSGVAVFTGLGLIGVGESSLWVLEAPEGETLVEIDLKSGKPVGRTELGYKCDELTVGFDSVWIACPIDQTIVRVDEKTGEIADEIADLSGSALVAIGPDAVWTNSSGESGGLARIDPESLEVTYVAGVPDPTSSGGIVVDGTDVWVHGQDDFLTQVGASGEVLAAYTSEELKGGSVFVAFGSVWATADDANTLVRLEL